MVEYGKPMKRMDRIAKVIAWPHRVFSFGHSIDSDHDSNETMVKVVSYLEQNDLADVRVYVNHYDPGAQWKRLRENENVGAGWRYSFGTLSWLRYTIFPGRVFGHDRYDPYSNSLYVNSDVPAVGLKEAAFAKDVHTRVYPGSYAAVTTLPLFSLHRSIHHADDVFGYARDRQDWELERQGYRTLYPMLGSETASLGVPFVNPALWWAGPAVGASGAAVGHVAGRTIEKRRDAELRNEQSAPIEPPSPHATESQRR